MNRDVAKPGARIFPIHPNTHRRLRGAAARTFVPSVPARGGVSP
jgi:hypothetical protein